MIRGAVLALALGAAGAAGAVNVTDTGAFSRLNVSVRGAALGGGITALDDGPEALAANPAGLARMGPPAAVVASSAVLPLGRALHYAGAAGWPTATTAAGFGALLYGAGGGLEVRTANTAAPDALAGAFAQAYFLGGAWRIFPPLELGLSLKLLLDRVADATAWGLTGDLGVAYRPVSRAALSFVIQDAGGPEVTALNWSTDASEEFGRHMRVGAALDLNPLLLVAELRDLGGPRLATGGGAELDVVRGFTLRAGLDDGRAALGFGARARLSRRADAALDYALARDPVDAGALQHRVAVTARLVHDGWPRGRLSFPTATPEPADPPRRPPPLLRWPGL